MSYGQYLFSELATSSISIPADIEVVHTSGWTTAGLGGAAYVVDPDAEALRTAHPYATFESADNRYWRLIANPAGAVTPEQLGCPVTGNAQPSIQAALNYAAVVGIPRIELPAEGYDLWAPIRNQNEHPRTGLSGHYMIVRENVSIVGTGRGKTLLRCLNSQGGTNDTMTQPNIDYNPPIPVNDDYYAQQRNWRGSGIHVLPNTSMDLIRLEKIVLDGTKTYNPNIANAPQVDLTHKGVRVQDVNCSRIEMVHVELINFGGEIMYTSGSGGVKEEYFQDCLIAGSPQSTINSGTSARSIYVNVRSGNSYQIEIVGGYGKDFFNCEFYDLKSLWLGGGAGAGPTGFKGPYKVPLRRPNFAPPYINFNGTTMTRCGNFVLTAFAKGKLDLVDTTLALDASAGGLTDIELTVTSILDAAVGLTEAVSVSGPVNLTTPIGNGSSRLYGITSNVRVDVTVGRTEAAKAAARTWQQAVRVYGLLMDPESVAFTVHGSGAERACNLQGTPVAGFKWPRIVIAPDFVPGNGVFGASDFFYLNGDQDIKLRPGVVAVEPQHDGIFTIGIDDSGTGFANEQMATIVHNSNNGRIVRFLAGSTSLKLPQDRLLINKGDRIHLRWDTATESWIETGYSTSAELILTGNASYDAPSIPPSGSASVTVSVPNASVGDFVSGLSFGSSGLQGLAARGEVTSAGTVTVWLANPTTGTIDLGAADIELKVARRFSA